MGNLGLKQPLPQRSAAFQQPDIEFGERAKAFFARVLPDSPPAILNVLLDNAFLPAGGDIAEVRIEQVVRGHGREARINDATLAFLYLVDGRLHPPQGGTEVLS